eukprot:g7091.t1
MTKNGIKKKKSYTSNDLKSISAWDNHKAAQLRKGIAAWRKRHPLQHMLSVPTSLPEPTSKSTNLKVLFEPENELPPVSTSKLEIKKLASMSKLLVNSAKKKKRVGRKQDPALPPLSDEAPEEWRDTLMLHNFYRCIHGLPAMVWNNKIQTNAEQYLTDVSGNDCLVADESGSASCLDCYDENGDADICDHSVSLNRTDVGGVSGMLGENIAFDTGEFSEATDGLQKWGYGTKLWYEVEIPLTDYDWWQPRLANETLDEDPMDNVPTNGMTTLPAKWLSLDTVVDGTQGRGTQTEFIAATGHYSQTAITPALQPALKKAFKLEETDFDVYIREAPCDSGGSCRSRCSPVGDGSGSIEYELGFVLRSLTPGKAKCIKNLLTETDGADKLVSVGAQGKMHTAFSRPTAVERAWLVVDTRAFGFFTTESFSQPVENVEDPRLLLS